MKKSKKEQIIEKATELFFENGISATSMDDIAAAVPVAKMTIYKYFNGKDSLLWEVIDGYVRRMHAMMTEKISRHPNPLDALLAIMNYKDMTVPDSFFKECFENYPQYSARIMEYYNRHIAGEFEQLILAGQRKGEIRKEISPYILTLYIQAIKDYFSKPEVLHGLSDFKAVGEQFRTMFLYGIVTPEYQKKNSPEGL